MFIAYTAKPPAKASTSTQSKNLAAVARSSDYRSNTERPLASVTMASPSDKNERGATPSHSLVSCKAALARRIPILIDAMRDLLPLPGPWGVIANNKESTMPFKPRLADPDHASDQKNAAKYRADKI